MGIMIDNDLTRGVENNHLSNLGFYLMKDTIFVLQLIDIIM
jgi:hypothetical protein